MDTPTRNTSRFYYYNFIYINIINGIYNELTFYLHTIHLVIPVYAKRAPSCQVDSSEAAQQLRAAYFLEGRRDVTLHLIG